MSEEEQSERSHLTPEDVHAHLRARMEQRGITVDEIEHVLLDGWPATDARSGTLGKTSVFVYGRA